MNATTDFKFEAPTWVTYEWNYLLDDGPMTTDRDGNPMRVKSIKIVLDANGKGISVDVEGIRTRKDGTRDGRRTWSTIEPYDGWVHEAIVEHYNAHGIVGWQA